MTLNEKWEAAEEVLVLIGDNPEMQQEILGEFVEALVNGADFDEAIWKAQFELDLTGVGKHGRKKD